MKKNIGKSIALILGIGLTFSGCGGTDGGTTQTDPLELESDGKTLVFYSASTNEQYAFEVDSQNIINLNAASYQDHNLTNFNMSASEKGKPFIWIDDKGDTNSSNDEGKLVMFKQEYSFANDGNATWEDFYYLGHFHSQTVNNQTSYYLAAHDNDEFNTTSGGKYNAMIRLNEFLAREYTLEQNLSAIIPSEANGLCGFHTFVNESGETFYYTIGKNGTVYVYDDAYNFKDSVAVSDSCMPNEMGMSSTEDGVLLFLKSTQKVYSVDSHEDGIYHIHNSWDVSRLIGSGHTADVMVGLEPLAQ